MSSEGAFFILGIVVLLRRLCYTRLAREAANAINVSLLLIRASRQSLCGEGCQDIVGDACYEKAKRYAHAHTRHPLLSWRPPGPGPLYASGHNIPIAHYRS